MSDAQDRAALQRLSPAVARFALRALGEAPLPAAVPPREELVARARAAAERALEASDPGAEVRRLLRELKYPLVARTILDDHDAGLPGVREAVRRITDLADALTEGALCFAREAARRRHGLPEDWPEDGGLAVFAMGKHGAEELNYSSDIDLVYVAAPGGETDGPRRVAAQRFADRIGRDLKAILEERTEDGFCFRVDLNLRPEGASGPLTISLPAAEHYFLYFGRTWERAAWMKARVCAGDRELGEELLRRIEPFRFRRSLDFGTLEDIASMRDRIAAAARRRAVGDDLKRGPGGIRELEFLVQAGQLAWCGRDRRLRVRGTREAAELLEERGALPAGVRASALGSAWRVLRAVEHRLQWPEEAQTQRLPPAEDTAAWGALALAWTPGAARTAGQVDPAALREALAEARALVERAWAGMMIRPEEPASPLEEAAALAVDAFSSPEERRHAMQELGFPDPDEGLKRLESLHRVGGTERMRPSIHRRFQRVAPRMLALAARSDDPEAALAALERFVGRVGARGGTYTLLHEHPAVADTLVSLFAASPLLADQLTAHPELLDTLLLRGRGGEVPPRDLRALQAVIEGELAARPELDDAILALRTFRTTEVLRIALLDLAGGLPSPGLPAPWLTAVARACVRGACRIADRAMEPRHGRLRRADGSPVPLGVLGLGSVGSGWMSYGSDLDLVFVYEPDADAVSDGSRPLDHRTFAARWGQRVITALTAPTREGVCYPVDLRLRPGGQGGAVVVSAEGLRAYYAERADWWELVALSRASVVAGEPEEFGGRLEDLLAEARARGGRDPAALVAEIRHMRGRQLAELARETEDHLHLKLGRGGLTDLEFGTAALQLTRGPGHPALRLADPLQVLGVLAERGDPVGEDLPELLAAYRELRRVEGHRRLRSTPGSDTLVFGSRAGRRVASALGLVSEDALRERVLGCRERIAAWTDATLARVAAQNPT